MGVFKGDEGERPLLLLLETIWTGGKVRLNVKGALLGRCMLCGISSRKNEGRVGRFGRRGTGGGVG